MSQNPPQPQFYTYQPETNGLAIAGCIISILGILTGGLLCPIGLIVSLVALGKPHGKGWAWSGVIVGLLGTCAGLIIFLIFGALILAALGLAIALSNVEQTEITLDMGVITAHTAKYEDDNGVLPANLELLKLPASNKTDPWGNPYRYLLDDTTELGFELISDGQDGKTGSSDDIYLSKLDELWEDAFKDLDEVIIHLGDDTYGEDSEDESEQGGDDG